MQYQEIYDKEDTEKTLLESKISYLSQQKEKAKLDQIESQKNFEKALNQIQKCR